MLLRVIVKNQRAEYFDEVTQHPLLGYRVNHEVLSHELLEDLRHEEVHKDIDTFGLVFQHRRQRAQPLVNLSLDRQALRLYVYNSAS